MQELFSKWNCKTSVSNPNVVMISKPLLEQLIAIAFGRYTFVESDYLDENPDISQSVSSKALICGAQHYIWDGILEGRPISDGQFQIEAYKKFNPDLVSAPGLNSTEALESHWKSSGWIEGRKAFF